MKAFYLLIFSAVAAAASPEGDRWYDAKGNVVRVTPKEESEKEKARANTNILVNEAVPWNVRRSYRPTRSRAIYYNTLGGYRYGFGCWPRSYYRPECRYGGYYRGTGWPRCYGSSLNVYIRR